MSDLDVKEMRDGCNAKIVVDRYSQYRGDERSGDIRISRPAGIVSARENNSREIATFQGRECLRRSNGR